MLSRKTGIGQLYLLFQYIQAKSKAKKMPGAFVGPSQAAENCTAHSSLGENKVSRVLNLRFKYRRKVWPIGTPNTLFPAEKCI